jgi:hypothetical protein
MAMPQADFNPIERVFAKLKHLWRKPEPRDVEATWRKVGELLDLFSPDEYANYCNDGRDGWPISRDSFRIYFFLREQRAPGVHIGRLKFGPYLQRRTLWRKLARCANQYHPRFMLAPSISS